MSEIEIGAFLNNELEPDMREFAAELSDGRAVGAYVAFRGERHFILPVGAPELLGDGPDGRIMRAAFEEQAREELADRRCVTCGEDEAGPSGRCRRCDANLLEEREAPPYG